MPKNILFRVGILLCEVSVTSSSLNELVFRSYIVMWVETLIKYIQQMDKNGVKDAWERIAKIEWKEGRSWIKENMSRVGLKGDDAVAGVELIRLGLQTLSPGLYSKKEFTIIEANPEKAVIETTAWCPVIDAAKRIKIDPMIPLNYILIPRLQGILQTVNPKLDVKIDNVDKSGTRWRITIELLE